MSGVSRSLGRRDFLGACACVFCSVVAGACASLVTRQLAPVDGKLELALTQYPELGEAGGALKIMPAGAVDLVYVLAMDDGSYSALSPICTHLGCTVEIEGPRLVCPCHGSAYDRAGTVLQGPAALPLARYRTNLSPDGVLTIDLRSRA